MIYTILEVANTHNGNTNYIHSLIDEFSEFKVDHGIKFQPFKYDEIADSDYEHYELYKSLFIDSKSWQEIILISSKSKDVWLDIFDDYGIQILTKNIDKVYGLKLQSSVLNNYNILKRLSLVDLSNKKVILNISGFELSDLKNIVTSISKQINCEELLLQIGFQAYPTEVIDSGLSKIEILKKTFSNRIVFADHSDGASQNATYLPVLASFLGVNFFEKHIMHSKFPTKYDYYSSINVNQYRDYYQNLLNYAKTLKQPFLVKNEVDYLSNTIQIPILNKNLNSGSLLDFNYLSYKRSNKVGLSKNQLDNLVNQFNLLSISKSVDETFKAGDFRKAKIATVVAARMKSTRLKDKAILKVGSYSSIELCIKNCLKFGNIDYTILATSNLKEDSVLKDHIYSNKVEFFTGHPYNVIQRYLDSVVSLNVDIVVRVTGDCPYVSSEIAEKLLVSHFETGADFTAAKTFAVGTSVEIINVEALMRIKNYFPNAEHSEYMSWYFVNNQDYFNVNLVELPENMVRNYRLTLDYEEDLKLFRIIEHHFASNEIDYTLENLFAFLDSNPEIAKMNSHLTLKYKSDYKLIDRLNSETRILKKN